MSAVHSPSAPGELAVPFVRMDRDNPELLEQLLDEVRVVAEQGAFTLGAHVEAFEADFAAYCEAAEAVGVASGTDALVLALRALGVGRGDEVIVPANTFIATAEAVSITGATPLPVDVDPETGLLTAAIVERALQPRVRCVIPVHLYGATVDMDPLLDLARAIGIAVVEDACQAHGARYKGRRVGALGDIGCFSFYPAKNLGAWGDGGEVRTVRDHRAIGSTARLVGLQAAELGAKLPRLDGWNAERREAAFELRRALEGTGVALPAAPAEGGDHVYHLFVVQAEDRDALRAGLAERGIASAVHYPVPVHRTDAYAHLGWAEGSLPVAERLAGRICSLPIFPGMDSAQIAAVAAAVAEVTRR